MRYKVHHTPLAKADRSYRRTCSQARETLGNHNRDSGRPEKLRVSLWWVLTRPRNSPQAGLKDLPSLAFHHPGLIRTR